MLYITKNIEYIVRKYETLSDSPPIQICTKIIDKRITFKIKSGYYLDLLTPETMSLLGSSAKKITKDKNIENIRDLGINEGNNDYQQDSRVLYTFIPNKSLTYLLNISSKTFIFLKSFSLESPYIKLCFTNQSSKPLEVEDEIHIK